ncbi:Uncharacterized protein BP5553_01400 [Venustampulla echinocandica]|uniref:Uncharacterized protein n=1 Tax=Venustampulla echinocandica TaxID=2656787 RepID=A0A370U0W8_9HELO|nr:Uncharacterized protein BP5553_01400 [Venustampulla echinocandica]RDL41421.1 Uncharacterized protein BP5553_01400 [Venustampulla echinocandica]
MAGPLNCTLAPSETSTDAGVAGAGVLLSFIITAGLSLLLSGIIILREVHWQSEAKVIRKLLLSFSDQQILTGIGIQSVGLAKMHSMVPYHFFIIWMLSLLSTATHIGTLLALVNDFKRDWVLRWLRQFFMFVNLVLSCISGVFVLMAVMRSFPATLPIACVWQVPSKDAPSNAAISIAGTIAVMAGQCILFVLGVWYLHVKERKWLKLIQIVGLLVIVGIGAGAAVRVVLLSQAFGSPSVPLRDTGEKEWSFGQLLPLLLLLLPLVSAVEISRGEMKVPSPVADDQLPLVDRDQKQSSDVRASFQPNPFWGSQYSGYRIATDKANGHGLVTESHTSALSRVKLFHIPLLKGY